MSSKNILPIIAAYVIFASFHLYPMSAVCDGYRVICNANCIEGPAECALH